jgi:nucleotide-binding universal stress UspA family protein
VVRIRQILCAVDFSDFSRHAFDRAVAVGRSHAAMVTALHVLPSAAAMTPVPFGPEGPGPFALHEVDREQLTGQLKAFLAIDHAIGVPVEFQVTEGSPLHREILLQADRLAADLLVLGTHGRSGFERLLLGSVTEKVLRRAKVPVLTVPCCTPDVLPMGRSPFNRVLCATDFSQSSIAAIQYAASLSREGAARLTVIHVVEVHPVVYEPTMATPFDDQLDWPARERACLAHLHTAIPETVRRACELEAVVTSGKPYIEILKAATDREADLIVLGVHGHDVLDRLVFGSTTAQVVRRAVCPVLTVRHDGRD